MVTQMFDRNLVISVKTSGFPAERRGAAAEGADGHADPAAAGQRLDQGPEPLHGLSSETQQQDRSTEKHQQLPGENQSGLSKDAQINQGSHLLNVNSPNVSTVM